MASPASHGMHKIISDHGHAAALQEFMVAFGWQSRYAPMHDAKRIGKAMKHLQTALNIVAALEKEESEERSNASS